MNIKTKYNIGDCVEFIREQSTVGGSKIEHLPEVGFIEKILVDGKKISYLLRSSFQNWVSEEEIKHVLTKK